MEQKASYEWMSQSGTRKYVVHGGVNQEKESISLWMSK
jgi:hypothetical protein